MLPQFTLYARIIFFMMVMFAFATTACSKKTNDYVIMLKNHERALHINAAGKVTATDISLAQFFTMESVTDALSDTFRIALYVKEVGRYLCFRKGKLVGMKHLVPDCHFIEKMDHGYFLYANAYKPEWRVGFTRGLKPVGPRHLQRPQTMRRACFLFVKINAEHFDRDMFTTTTTTTTTTTMSPLKKLIESRDQHSIRDYGLEEYERRLNSSRGRNYRNHSRTEPDRRRGSTGGGGGGGVVHRHRSPETRHRNVSNTPQPKNLRRPQPTQKAGEERRKKTQRENVRRVHTNGQRKRKQVDSHYDHSDLPPNSQSSRAGGGTSSSSSSASSTASVTATSLAATVSLAPSALNLVAMLAASRRKRVKRKKLEEEQEQEESETQASGGNAEKQRSANSDLQLVAHDDGHESEQLYDLPAKKARKSQTPHDHSYHQKSSYAEQMPVATTPEHFVQQPQNHKYSNSNAKKFHSHKRSNNSHHSRNSHRQQQLQEEGEERDEEEEEEAENPSHSLSSSGNNNNNNNYLNENLSKLTKLKTNTNINLNLNTNINNNTNNLNANAILPALPKNFNNTDKQNSHNNQAKQYLNLMTDFKQLQTPTPALNVSQQPQHQQHHRRQHHNNNGVKHSLRRHRHKRDLGFSLPQLSATSQMTRPQPRSNADELRGLVNKENELPTFHRRSSDVESLDNSKRVEYEEEHNYEHDDADENGGDTINKSNRLLDNNNNNHKHLSEDNNFLQQQQQRPQPSGLPFNRLKHPNNDNRISSDDDDDDDDDVDVSSMKLQKQNIPNEHNIASHSLESDANYNPMKIRYNKANYLTAAATTTTKNNNNNINITNNVNKPNASFSGVFSQLNVINNNYMRHQSRSRSSSSSSSGSSVSAVKKTNVNNNITRHNVIIISNVLNNDDIDVSGSGAAATATATAFQTRFVLGQKNMYRQLQQQKTQQQQV
uniref:Uncharacterized protein n=1 Tax=Musca domestica TaxID=7370 RepID=A0A1I8MKB9_MUSDO